MFADKYQCILSRHIFEAYFLFTEVKYLDQDIGDSWLFSFLVFLFHLCLHTNIARMFLRTGYSQTRHHLCTWECNFQTWGFEWLSCMLLGKVSTYLLFQTKQKYLNFIKCARK